MARPRNADSEQTRQRLLAAAGELFASQGLDGVSVREIAGAAKVTGATVLHYFGGKDALYDACIESMYEQLGALRGEVVEAMAGATDMDGAIERGMRAVFRIARKNQDAIRLLLRHVVDTGEIGTRRREKQLLPFLDTGVALLREHTGQSDVALRCTLQSLVFLVGRWAISSQREASAVAGIKGPGAFTAIEDHLVSVARRQLSAPPGRP